MTWTDTLTDRERQEIALARIYDTHAFRHGTTGHAELLLISHLAQLLDAQQGARDRVPDPTALQTAAQAAVGAWLADPDVTRHDAAMSSLHAVLSGTDMPSPLALLIAAARAAGAAGTWIIRGASGAALVHTSDATRDVADWPALGLTPPHDMIVLIRIPQSDGGPDGTEFFGPEE